MCNLDRGRAGRDFERHVRQIDEVGYTIVEDAIEPTLVDAIDAALAELAERLRIVPGANAFEGHRTIRIYNLLAHQSVFESVPVHASVLPIVERVLVQIAEQTAMQFAARTALPVQTAHAHGRGVQERVRAFAPRLQEPIGFGAYKHLMGHIDKKSAAQALLGRDDGFRSVWERIEPRR